MDCDFFIQASKIENQKRTGVITYEESKIYFNALNKCTSAQVRDDIARSVFRRGVTPTLNNQTSKAKSNFNSGSRLNLESRSSSLLSLSNRFQAFDNINNDLDSDDCVNSISPKTNNEIKIAVGRTGNAKVHRTNRKFDSYAHSVKSCSLDPVSDDSFNLDSSSE